ncbi:hypothetical protein FRC02_006699, partial [Tulasnella sp. 418]
HTLRKFGQGKLTGAIKTPEDLPPDYFRDTLPRFKGEVFKFNMKPMDCLGESENPRRAQSASGRNNR